MSFVEPTFVAFMVIVLAAYWLVGKRRPQNLLLIAVSCLFYGWIHPWLVGLLLFSALLDYFCARKIAEVRSTDDEGAGGWWMALAVLGNIGTLCFFKYADFFIVEVATLLEGVGVESNLHALGIFLPVGLSFYTFQSLAYTIDVYREQLDVRDDVVDYLVFICFFPQLVAGPVERAANVLPQFETARTFDWHHLRGGLGLAMFGAFKKVVLADTLAPYVNLMFAVEEPSFAMVWAGALGFTVQVLADFSGYTDIARGTARMFGIELMDNFDHPYLASTPMEFWRRWHISFSTWLRDYLYLPLSFSPWVRKYLTIPGTEPWGYLAHTSRALFFTMLASGLWHGSTANFVAWGMYYWVIGSLFAWGVKKIPKKVRKSRDWRPLTVPMMFVFTLVGMLIFREPDVMRTLHHFTLNPLAGTTNEWIVSSILVTMTLLAAIPSVIAMLFEFYVQPKLRDSEWYLPLETTTWAFYTVCLFTFVRPSAEDFIYFQF